MNYYRALIQLQLAHTDREGSTHDARICRNTQQISPVACIIVRRETETEREGEQRAGSQTSTSRYFQQRSTNRLIHIEEHMLGGKSTHTHTNTHIHRHRGRERGHRTSHPANTFHNVDYDAKHSAQQRYKESTPAVLLPCTCALPKEQAATTQHPLSLQKQTMPRLSATSLP